VSNDQKWRKLLHWLRKNFYRDKDIYVRRKLCDKDHGVTFYDHGYFRIVIDKKQSWALIEDTLLHEWAHALTWFGNDTDDHGEEWGLMHTKIYREFLEWNYGN